MSHRLGINTCFAVKRWPLPDEWAAVVREELGLDLVQHSLDLVDPSAPSSDPPPAGPLGAQADAVRDACAANRLELGSVFTGLAAYSTSMLLHPDAAARERARAWLSGCDRVLGPRRRAHRGRACRQPVDGRLP